MDKENIVNMERNITKKDEVLSGAIARIIFKNCTNEISRADEDHEHMISFYMESKNIVLIEISKQWMVTRFFVA